ncbi:MAG: hypothetical protein ACWA5K_01755 [bacterium]
MWAKWFLIGIVAVILIWLFFVRPAEKRAHQQKLDAIQRKLESIEKSKQVDRAEDGNSPSGESGDDTRSDDERK